MKFIFYYFTSIFLIGCSTSHLTKGYKEPKDFKISTTKNIVDNSLYSQISLIDSREDKKSLGLLRIGGREKLIELVSETPFKNQIQEVIDSAINETATNDTIVFQLRNIQFIEHIDFFKFGCSFHLRFSTYKKINSIYYPITTIDTTTDINRSLFYSKRKLIRKAGINFQQNIINNLRKAYNKNIAFSLEDLSNIDSIEKSLMPLYTNKILKDGIYLTYQSFKNKIPDKSVYVEEVDDEEIYKLFEKGTTNNFKKVRIKKVYAIVWNGKAYISNFRRLILLKKSDNNYFFIGKALSQTQDWRYSKSPIFEIGEIGDFSETEKTKVALTRKLYHQQIDHLNGRFIRLELVK